MRRIKGKFDRCGPLGPLFLLAHNPKVAGSNPAPANPFNRSSITTTVAVLRSSGHDLNPQLSPFARSGCYGSSYDTESPPKNGCFKNVEDMREAGAVIVAREWTSHAVESTVADVGPFPSIRTQGYHRIDARGAMRRKESA
jgi:hypothetical protein